MLHTGARLGPFEVGQIKAHLHHGLSGAAIVKILKKPDCKSSWSAQAVYDAIAKLNEQPTWRGERAEGSGAPRKTTKMQDRELERFVLANRGKLKVTVPRLRREFAWTGDVSDSLLEDRLHEAGLRWLRRRRKTIVTKMYLKRRVEYCHAALAKKQKTLDTWAYTDGTVFYLDRDIAENEETHLAALGGWVWRRSDRRDALFQENLGPSTYRKAQGAPVRIWGVLAAGTLYVHVIDEGEVMNTENYVELIEDEFETWMASSNYLVADFERCLRSEAAINALQNIGIDMVDGYPVNSQDFNAIENCWKLLRDRLFETLPRGLEGRDAFIARLKEAVAYLNRHEKDRLWYCARNQRERCKACLSTKPVGGRTKW